MKSSNVIYTFDIKRISKTLLDLAEEDMCCPDNRKYISSNGLTKVRTKVNSYR